MKGKLRIILIFVILECLGTGVWAIKNKAVLMNAGKFFYNYRMENNLHIIKNMLHDSGFDEQDMIVFGCDSMPCNPVVSPGGTLRHVPGDKTASLLRENYEMDYTVEDTNPQKFLEVLTHRYHRYETNYKKLDRDGTTNFYMYMIGHGGDEYFKLQDTTVIFAQELENFLHDPANELKSRSQFLFSDSCSAGTLFHSSSPKNSVLMGSSGWDQKSTSADYDDIYSMPLNDKYVLYFAEFFKERLKKKLETSLADVKNYLSKGKLGDADILDFNHSERGLNEILYSEFMAQNEPRQIKIIPPATKEEKQFIDEIFNLI